MNQSFFFYDLETSGFDARYDRILQFAGQRTDLNIKPISKPYNFLIKLTDDVLPNPDALLVSGISPKKTIDEGYTEHQAAKLLHKEVFTAGTIVVGFNNIRFDDEFIRYLFWRNFVDPYQWAWKEQRSRWDLLDTVRITRALRPNGIAWPYDKDNKPTNRLQLLAEHNNIKHTKAHDALSDVQALIGLAKLIYQKQPKLFTYMLKIRSKTEVAKLVNLESKQPFLYVSGSLLSNYNKATVAFPITCGPNSSIVIYDLRYDPSNIVSCNSDEIGKKLFSRNQVNKNYEPVPIKLLWINKSPAVVPLSVLTNDNDWQNIGLNQKTVMNHLKTLLKYPDFIEKIQSIYQSRSLYNKSEDPEAQLYDGFIPDADQDTIQQIMDMSEPDLVDFHPQFVDERLCELLLHYKARNFPNTLTENETKVWQQWRKKRVNSQLENFNKSYDKIIKTHKSKSKKLLLDEIKIYVDSIVS